MSDLNLVGRTVGRFEIIEELGRGGMAVVYRARQADLARMVALKVLPPELSLDKSYIARFLQEARSAAALEHPHIVPIFEVGSAEGVQYIAMKYISGHTLKEVVQQQGALDIQRAVTMLEQVSDALDYAHSHGVIHRDIKPSNMMLEKNGWVYLTDFGLARGGSSGPGLTMAGTVMGTPEYMSPEQAQGLATIGPPTDIYALGVVLYELLTGQMPFQADTPMGMLVARLQFAPRPPRDYRGDLPLPVEDVIMRALARKPEARYPSAKEMILALKNAAGLSTRTLAPQRPFSPPQGTPVGATPQPPSPSYGEPTQFASPAHGVPQQGMPPRGAPQQGTPPYVIPANVGPTVTAPRAATPPSMPAPALGEASPLVGTAAPAAQPRSRRGVWIAVGGLALVLVLALLLNTFVLSRPRVDPRVTQGLTEGATAFGERGGFDKAIAGYQKVLAADPKHVEAHSQLALIYNLRDRYQDAEASARDAIEADPQTAFAHAILAETLINQGEYEEALQAAEKAVELDANLSAAYTARANVKAVRAIQASDLDLLEQAAADAEKAIELAPKTDNLAQALAHNARGYVAWQEFAFSDSTDQSRAEQGGYEFTQAIALQPQIATFHSNMGYFYNAQGEHAQSEGDEDQAQEKFDLAVQQFEEALDADPEYAHAHAGLGWNLYYLEDYDGALNEFDKAIEINSQDVDAHTGKSRAYQAQDEPDFDLAIEELNAAAQASPKDPNVFANLGWLYRDRAMSFEYESPEQQESYQEAETQFRKALELNESYVNALTGLGWVLQDQADVMDQDAIYEEAVKTLEESLAIKEEQPGAYNALGWSYYGLTQYDQAEESFRRATELLDGYANAYYGLGLALEAQGKTDEARQAYQSGADNGSSDAQEALERLE